VNLDPDEEVNMEKVREINVEIGDATAACKGKMSHKADGYDTLKKIIVPESKRLIAPPAVKKVYYGAWANDSTHVCLAGQEGNLHIYDAVANKMMRKPIPMAFPMACAIHITKDGKWLVAGGGMDNAVSLYDHSSISSKASALKTMTCHEGYISTIKFLGDGAKMLTCSGDGYSVLTDLSTGKEVRRFTGHEQDVSGLSMVDPAENVFGTSSTDKTVRIWDSRQPWAVRKFTAKYAANCVAMLPESRGVVCGCDNASYEFFDVGSNQQVGRGKVKKGRCESIAVSASGRITYTGWDNFMLNVADTYAPGEMKEMTPDNQPKNGMHTDAICSMEVAPDGSALMTTSFDKSARIWGAPLD